MYAALVCHLMVSTNIIHAITWITTHCIDPEIKEGRVGLVGWPIVNTLPIYQGTIDQGKSASHANSAFHPSGASKSGEIHLITWIMGWKPLNGNHRAAYGC